MDKGIVVKMSSTDSIRKGPNQLLRGLIIVSLCIHTLILMHITDLYKSKSLQYIELNLRQEKKALSRGIPRPPMLSRAENKKSSREKAVWMDSIQIPDLNQMSFGQGDTQLSSSLMEGITGMSKKGDYYEMIRLKIDQKKKWIKETDGTYKEGVVTLGFIIDLDGNIKDLKIVKPSPFRSLNEAALQAVRDSIPFLKPPPNLFKNEIPFELTVRFNKI